VKEFQFGEIIPAVEMLNYSKSNENVTRYQVLAAIEKAASSGKTYVTIEKKISKHMKRQFQLKGYKIGQGYYENSITIYWWDMT